MSEKQGNDSGRGARSAMSRLIGSAAAALFACLFAHCILDVSDTAEVVAPLVCPHANEPDSVDAYDPQYRVLSPNGGEVFHVGEPCSLKVSSKYYGSGVIEVVMGRRTFSPPVADPTVELPADSLFVFTIPDSFERIVYDPVLGANVLEKYSSVSDSCLIKLRDYDDASYYDYTDCYFAIRP